MADLHVNAGTFLMLRPTHSCLTHASDSPRAFCIIIKLN